MRLTALLIVLAIPTLAQAKIVTKAVEYRHGDVTLEGYLAYNDELSGRRPGVLVVHEWWGLNDYVKKRAEMLAELGYVAFALDMYGKGVVTDDPAKAGQLAGALRGKPLLVERARAGLDVLVKQPNVDPERVAVIGYCFGGTTALQLALSGAPLKAAVSFHGALKPVPTPEQLEKTRATLLICHGAVDPMVPDEEVDAFTDALEQSKVDWMLIAYSGAVHSFTNPEASTRKIDGVAYDEKADKRSWAHMKALFEEVFGEKGK